MLKIGLYRVDFKHHKNTNKPKCILTVTRAGFIRILALENRCEPQNTNLMLQLISSVYFLVYSDYANQILTL